MRLATVLCSHTVGSTTLFFVFKGTSYLLDFINWNLEHDFEFVQDRHFFAHKGAASTIRNLFYLKEENMCSRLEAAASQGATSLVFCGHSLGGMYALVSLFMVFTKSDSFGQKLSCRAQELLKTARSITFGAPMAFGVLDGSQQNAAAENFRAFAKERALNYIHANDPCPRAWSALDLRRFLQCATEALKKELPEKAGGAIRGALAARVVDAAVEQLLQRKDFNLITECAAGFQHSARLKVLSEEGESKPAWRWDSDFRLSAECL